VRKKARYRARQKTKRGVIKAAGGAEYEALLEKERAARARWRSANPDRYRELQKLHKKDSVPFKTALCAGARFRGRKRGLAATIRPADLVWPSHCPVLGLELDYPELSGQRGGQHAQPNWPSLDRFDPKKGYAPGNVFVISYRANTLKNSATYEEILKIAKYLARPPRYDR
jgi:hypothetical protein